MTSARYCICAETLWQFYLSLKTEPNEVFYMELVGNLISSITV